MSHLTPQHSLSLHERSATSCRLLESRQYTCYVSLPHTSILSPQLIGLATRLKGVHLCRVCCICCCTRRKHGNRRCAHAIWQRACGPVAVAAPSRGTALATIGLAARTRWASQLAETPQSRRGRQRLLATGGGGRSMRYDALQHAHCNTLLRRGSCPLAFQTAATRWVCSRAAMGA